MTETRDFPQRGVPLERSTPAGVANTALALDLQAVLPNPPSARLAPDGRSAGHCSARSFERSAGRSPSALRAVFQRGFQCSFECSLERFAARLGEWVRVVDRAVL
ncbi:hypothetical protein RHA1_ro11291 (plasmid) [Rhodococcus jostii RHA1]|uniref:Uncharacterized protein n=1 Tax=Rhodococcus jostii (strain RHA1) TaxID=101510 RepID=Q0RUU8_RHOJR|nr:hypothetical protein RHA1_ro11291 [Rhodococcus jostii RHA1]